MSDASPSPEISLSGEAWGLGGQKAPKKNFTFVPDFSQQ